MTNTSQQPASTTDEHLIRQIVADRVDAMRERDADRFVSHYAAGVVKFDLAPPLRSSGAAARDAEALRAWFADKGTGPIGYEVHDLDVAAAGTVAFCHSLNRMGNDGGFTMWFRATLGLRKIDDAWRVTHEHNSTPFSMDGSGRAAVDLRPDGETAP